VSNTTVSTTGWLAKVSEEPSLPTSPEGSALISLLVISSNTSLGSLVAASLAPNSMATPSRAAAAPTSPASPSLLAPVASRLSRASRLVTEMSGATRVAAAPAGREASTARRCGEWKSRRSWLKQILAPRLHCTVREEPWAAREL